MFCQILEELQFIWTNRYAQKRTEQPNVNYLQPFCLSFQDKFFFVFNCLSVAGLEGGQEPVPEILKWRQWKLH